MSAVVDVGDAFELTFTSATGASVTVTWIDPDGNAVLDNVTVAESAQGSYPVTLTATAAGMWTANFAASGTVTAVESYYVRARALSGLPPLAAIGDVSAQYGTLTVAQEGLSGYLLRAASAMIRHDYPYIGEQVASGRLNADLVALAAANMVVRVLRNPNGLKAETVGPFSRTYDTTVAAGLLVISATEQGLLTPTPATRPGGVGGIGSIRTVPGLAPPPRHHGDRYGSRYGGLWR